MARIVKHKKPDTIWLYDYPSLASMDDCAEWLVFLSERDLNIIYNAIQNIERYQSRVFIERHGVNYTIVDDTQFEDYKNWVATMRVNLESFFMCNDILERIADALEGMGTMATNGCCGSIEGVNGGSAGSGMEDAPSETLDTPLSNEGDPPPRYSSWEEFHTLKCDWATYIINQMKTDVATMGLVNVAAEGATGLAAILVPLLIEPVGWVVLLSIAVVMIAAAATSGFYGFISTHLETYFDDYVCALLGGTSTDNSVSQFAIRVDANVADDGNFNTLTGYWASTILKGLGTVASFNRMFDRQNFTPPTAECDCGEPGEYAVDFGNETSEHPSNPIVIETTFVSGWGCGSDTRELAVSFSAPVTITSITGDTGLGCGTCTGHSIYNYFSDNAYTTGLFSSNNRPQDEVPATGVMSFYVLYDCDGNTPTLTIDYTVE